MSVLIHKTGIQASIQDLGRRGYQRWGIPIGGVMDEVAAKLANLICENSIHAPVIEFTLQGAQLEFTDAHKIALTGGGSQVIINGNPAPMNQLLIVEKGAILTLQPNPLGCRTYLAVQGGFVANRELDSASTYQHAGLGGINGKNLAPHEVLEVQKINTGSALPDNAPEKYALQAGTSLGLIGKGFSSEGPQVSITNPALQAKEVWIDACKGPEWDWFDEDSQQAFFSASWKIDAQSNRMGYRLKNVLLKKTTNKELISTPVTRGIIQVTPDGNPLLLMADAQTIGGYPRIARVCPADLSILGQCAPGYIVHFNCIDELTSLKKKSDVLANGY